ncbi:hypothetical protein ACJIZ3_005040 [Penstemon smallii]|uniref:Uncharacterized protein n=1 Tax=Penstemon smallii TaxID=265156 RepID=A0ABD3S3S6_9LAMI
MATTPLHQITIPPFFTRPSSHTLTQFTNLSFIATKKPTKIRPNAKEKNQWLDLFDQENLNSGQNRTKSPNYFSYKI